jgi:NADH:ubiquinone oxidoreductase subunit 3 (subunit A)
LTGIWYIVGFAFAGVSFVFLTIGAAWLISHRNRGDEHKGLPYESGIDTYGDTHGRFGLSFYIYALLFVAFDIEVVFIYLWAINFNLPSSPNPTPAQMEALRVHLVGGLVSMLVFVSILLLGLAYAWRKGALSWR